MSGHRSARPWLLVALAAAAAGCAGQQPRIHVPERPPMPPGAVALAYVGTSSTGFLRPDGRSCQRPPAQPRRGVVGWSAQGDDLACLHDTLDAGVGQASLELHFRTAITADGSYDLLTRGLALDAWGRVVARGGAYGEYTSHAWVELAARAPSCAATSVQELGAALVTGPWERPASFSGWVLPPDLALEGCRAHEVLEVRLRLVGTSNRGRIEVQSFGVVAGSAEELQDALALARRAPGAAPGTAGATAPASPPAPPGPP